MILDFLTENSQAAEILLNFIGAVFSGVCAYLAAVHKCRGEMQAMKLQWQHERLESVDVEFTALLRDIIEYCHSDLGYSDQLLPSVMAFRAKAPAGMDDTLSALYSAVLRDDRQEAEALAVKLVRLSRSVKRC